MKHNTFKLRQKDHTIRGWIKKPDISVTRKVPLVILMHGVTLDKDNMLLQPLTDGLLKKEFAVLSFDFFAHGDSGGRWQEMSVGRWVKDAEEVLVYAGTLPYITDIFVVGHSQGGLTASIVAGRHPDLIKAMALYAPAAVIEDVGKEGNLLGVRFKPRNIPERVPFFSSYLGRDFFRSAQKLHVYDTAVDYNGPVCILQGTSDEMVPLSYAWKYHYIYKGSKLYLFKDEDHMFHNHREDAAEVVVEFLMECVQ
ncbi:MAG: alpha/beta hydrolase [Eubacterium sp.]|nr:alpha/beta hydrolase [Eubacterium sp.]